tara:strand:- start:441 stop:2180 length:1740 start_codon:yes stop_codon:yes gene_type:complete
MIQLKYSEILKLNKELENNIKSSSYRIVILSNIIVHQIKEILEYSLRSAAINANVEFGDYDNIIQDSHKYKDSNAIIIFWELSNIIDGIQYKIELMNRDQLDELFNKTKSEIDLMLKTLENAPIVLINKFTSLPFSHYNISKSYFDKLAKKLNHYLEKKIPDNVRLIDFEKVISLVGVSKSLDLRYYYSSKALYTIDFFKVYVEYIKPFMISANGKSKKALIFDCDNTLWKNILGEDGFDNIEMSPNTKDGAIFAEIQSIALALNKKGVLIGLCSKNNPGDINEVLESHSDMQLKNDHITINKSNWSDKVTNLKEISKELNIGLDSLVFIDDSSFEVSLIRQKLPEVTVLQVPKLLYEYPKMLRENMPLFYNLSFTAEDEKKIDMYKNQANRKAAEKEFSDIEDYLSSLELEMTIFEDDESIIPRMSQMSQKTNQFNLTTKRYTERNIKNYIDDLNTMVFAFSISDKFGDSGITGLSICTSNGGNYMIEIDTLLMSCRVIGRNIEYAFLDHIIHKIKEKKITEVKAKYIKTAKNEQVSQFFDNCFFDLIDENDLVKNYMLAVKRYKPKELDYINIVSAK